MTTTQTTTKSPSSNPSSVPASSKAAAKQTTPKTGSEIPSPKPVVTVTGEFPVQNQIAPFQVKKKKNDKKVIRDSFSFPQQDYHKISELKKICLAAGVHVKKGELLRAGLHLLTEMKLSELIKAVGKIERVKTGRPKTDKK